MYSCTSIEISYYAILLDSALAGNDADILIGQADGIEVGDVHGFLILWPTLANGDTGMILVVLKVLDSVLPLKMVLKETHS